jgi:hypothetical protein
MTYVGLRVMLHGLDDAGATVEATTPRQLASEIKALLLERYGLPFDSSVEVDVLEHAGLCLPDCEPDMCLRPTVPVQPPASPLPPSPPPDTFSAPPDTFSA